ncbi:ABZJ_00895 family protein [Gymnodinialimonas hymeniacidonis]|uniref:ABZJ_00895 family protein n=1 Tax=Gymnodinialimonas hymeniacidonis TaxID=3126508 RepID=UPI0034C5CE40
MRFALTLVSLFAFIWGGSNLLAQFAPDIAMTLSSGPFAIGIFVGVMIFPPLQLAQIFYRHEQRHMTGGEGWGLAVIGALLFVAVMCGVVYLRLWQNPTALADLQREIGGDFIIAFLPLGVLVVFLMLVYRLFFWAAIRGQIKRAERSGT